MIEIKLSISKTIVEKLKSVNPDIQIEAADVADMLEYPPDPKMGDLALPCFKMSKIMRTSPVRIATQIAEEFSAPCVERAEALNGYFNIFGL